MAQACGTVDTWILFIARHPEHPLTDRARALKLGIARRFSCYSHSLSISSRQDIVEPLLACDLSRFHDAQAPVYERALAELRAGRKQSHWMWFIFPQYAGLGLSAMSQRYAIRSLGEAVAYLADPALGRRLVECVEAVLAVPEKSAHDIFGSPDDVKFRSSLTLFATAASDPSLFEAALQRFYGGVPDARTLDLLNGR